MMQMPCETSDHCLYADSAALPVNHPELVSQPADGGACKAFSISMKVSLILALWVLDTLEVRTRGHVSRKHAQFTVLCLYVIIQTYGFGLICLWMFPHKTLSPCKNQNVFFPASLYWWFATCDFISHFWPLMGLIPSLELERPHKK
jgi:hypothetical protein